MTLQAWPSTLVPYLAKRDGLTMTGPNELLRTTMDRGPARQRRATQAAVVPLKFQIELSEFEFEVFKTFYSNRINGGASWFVMPCYIGENYVVSEARFVEPWTMSDNGHTQVIISLSLELRRPYVITEGTLFMLETYGAVFAASLADRLQPIVNQLTAGGHGYPYAARNNLP